MIYDFIEMLEIFQFKSDFSVREDEGKIIRSFSIFHFSFSSILILYLVEGINHPVFYTCVLGSKYRDQV